MTRRGKAASAASIAVVALITGLAFARAEATDGAAPATACATTTACVEGDNSSSGPGVKGTSTKGHGIVGTTKSKGTTQGSSHAGVFGQDLQTGGGTGNIGVEGTSTNGTGIEGSSANIGILGVSSANSYGVVGEGLGGTFGSGSGVGVTGASSSGEGVGGSGAIDDFIAYGGGDIFRGLDANSNSVFVVDPTGNAFAAGNVSLDGNLISNGQVIGFEGLFGGQVSVAEGIVAQGSLEGVEGESPAGGDSIFANGFGGDLFRGNNSHGADVFIVDDGGNVFANTFTGGLAETTLQRTSAGASVKTYSAQITQPTLEDDGEARLVNGVAQVPFDPAFAASIERSSYMVTVTPEGLTRGVLCVVQRTAAGFVVAENMGGRSNVPFSYRVVAKPYGSTAPRLPIAALPAHFDRPMTKIGPPKLRRVPAPTRFRRPIVPLPNIH